MINYSAVLAMVLLTTATSVATAQQTVTLTSTADFQQGNNEGLISTANNRLTRDAITAGTLGSWSDTTALSLGRWRFSCVVYNGFIYAMGGWDPDINQLNDVLYAPINSDGSIGSWSNTTAIPYLVYGHSSFAYNGFVYIVGAAPSTVGDPLRFRYVYAAPINADGSLGAWFSTTALPGGRRDHQSVAYNGFVYVLGQENPNNGDDVLVAPIHADGNLGEWTSAGPLPFGRCCGSTVAYNGFLYSIGGQQSSGEWPLISDVIVAPINADGSLGEWTSTSSLPAVRGYHSSVVYNGFVYAIGGFSAGFETLSDVQVAPINADGSLGSWSSTATLPAAREGSQSVALNGFVYTLGAGNNSDANYDSVVMAAIGPDSGNGNQAPELLRGAYSHLVDLQDDFSNQILVINGQLSPGGVLRLQVRIAPEATGEFGAETVVNSVTLGSPIVLSGNGRYVWIRVTLDDTDTTSVSQPTYVSDITVTTISPPAPGTVSDGSAADIDTQNSTTTIEANWSGFTASPGDSIDFYEWAIGTAPGSTNVQNWTNVGGATSASTSSLSLTTGMKFVSVRATSVQGLTSTVATSDGVQVIPAATGAPAEDEDDKEWWKCNNAAGASGSLTGLLFGLAILVMAGFRNMRRHP